MNSLSPFDELETTVNTCTSLQRGPIVKGDLTDYEITHQAAVFSVLAVVAVFIMNAIIVSVLIFFFYWFYMRPTRDCKTRAPYSSCFSSSSCSQHVLFYRKKLYEEDKVKIWEIRKEKEKNKLICGHIRFQLEITGKIMGFIRWEQIRRYWNERKSVLIGETVS